MQWLQNLVLVLGLGGLLGGLLVSVWASRAKGLQELLKTENAAYKESNQRLNEENRDVKTRLNQAEAELAFWKDNVTQRPQIEKLITMTTKRHGEYMTEIGAIAKSIAELTNAVTLLLKEADNGAGSKKRRSAKGRSQGE